MRKLASIQQIISIEPIVGRDVIQLAKVLGYQVVVSTKDGLKVGDLCVFIECDSVLPSNAPWSQFLEAKGFEVNPTRIRGVLSQGLIVPLSTVGLDSRKEGEDVSEYLGVTKQLDPEYKQDKSAEYIQNTNGWPFPKNIPNTNLERFAGLTQKEVAHITSIAKEVTITEKLDGCSITIWFNDMKEIQVASKKIHLKPDAGSRWNKEAQKLLPLFQAAGLDDPNLVFQGEMVGPGCNHNWYDLKEDTEVYFYTMYRKNPETRHLTRMPYFEMSHTLKKAGIKVVPFVAHGDPETLFSVDFSMLVGDKLDPVKSKIADKIREGVVAVIQFKEGMGPIISKNDAHWCHPGFEVYKAICPKFLIAKDKF